MTRPLTYDRLRRILPDVDALAPILDEALRTSLPDPELTWSGAGELGTAGSRIIDVAHLAAQTGQMAERARARAAAVLGHAVRAVEAAERNDMAGAAFALLEAAATEERAGEAAAAQRFAAAAVDATAALPDHPVRGLALRRQARAERGLGAFDQAVAHYAEAFEVARALGDQPGMAEAAIGSGNVEEQRGRWADARRWYEGALAALAPLPASPAHWHVALNLHIVLRSMGHLDESRSWLDLANSTAESIEDPASGPFLSNAEGQLLMAEGAFARAEQCFLDALSAVASPFASVTVRLNLSESLLAQARGAEAAEQARRAERDALAGRVTTKLAEVYRLLGRVAVSQDNVDAFVLFERALELSAESEAHAFERAQTLQAYAAAEEAVGNPDAARLLRSRAVSAYRALGSAGFRRPWADCFDVPLPDPPTIQPDDA